MGQFASVGIIFNFKWQYRNILIWKCCILRKVDVNECTIENKCNYSEQRTDFVQG